MEDEDKSGMAAPLSWWKTPRLTTPEIRYLKSIEDVFKVKDAAKRWIPYKLMPHQMDFHKNDIALKGKDARSRVVVKSRNTSFTTSVCISNLMAVPYYPNQILPFVRLNERRAYDLIDEIKDLIRNMEPTNMDGVLYPFNPKDVNMDSAGKIRFPNKVSFEAYPANAIAAENIRGLRISGSAGVLDECFTNGTRIYILRNGKEELIKISAIRPTDEVQTFNELTKTIEYKKINCILKRNLKIRDLLQFTFISNKIGIECTLDHPFYDENFNIIPANKLSIGDTLICNNNTGSAAYTQQQKEILYGIILGDGYISKPRKKLNSSHISITHGMKQVEYADYVGDILDLNYRRIYKIDRMINGAFCNTPLYQIHGKFKSELLELRNIFYKDGKKIITKDILDLLTPASLAFWYMDDGSLSGKAAALHTENFSKEENEIIRSFFKTKFNIDCIVGKSKQYTYILFQTESTRQLFKLISKYIPPYMQYKLTEEFKNKYKTLNIIKNNYKKCKIKNIKKINKRCRVYNLDVKDNHNFFVGSNKILVHNCNFMDNFNSIYTSLRDAASGYTLDGEKHFQINNGTTLKGTTTQFALWFKKLEEMQKTNPQDSDFDIYRWQVFDPALFDKEIPPAKQPGLIPIVPWHLMSDLNRKYLEDLNTFLEEYMAVAVDGSEQFYPTESYEKNVDRNLKSINTPSRHGEFYMGIDVASVMDYFVLSIFENIPEERLKIEYIRQENGDIIKKNTTELVDVFYQRYLYYDRDKDLSFMEQKTKEIIENWAQFGLKKVRVDSAGIGLQLYQNLRVHFGKKYPNLIEYIPMGSIKVGNESKKAKEVVHVNQKQLMIYERVKFIQNDVQKMHYSMWNYKYECERNKEYGHGDTTIANAYALLPLNFQGKRQYGDIIMAQEEKPEEAKTCKEIAQDFQKMSWKDKKKYYRSQ